MFDLSGTLEDSIVKTKKLCNKIEMSVDGCDDVFSLKTIFHIHRHLRDILRKLESGELDNYTTPSMTVDGLNQAFEKVMELSKA